MSEAKKPAHLQRGEFERIAAYFAPLATAPGALGLTDDAALVSVDPAEELVLTTDMMVAGVHFPAQAEPEEIAAKILAVNVSDLAAMGATPVGYLLDTALTNAQDDAWLERFSGHLGRDQARYGMTLFGGDTVSTPGPLALTLTAFGTIPKGQALKRSGAKPGDAVYVSGTLGDAALGLAALEDGLADLDPAHRAALIERFRFPQPRWELGLALRGIAHGAADISDGLLADLGHICETSGVGATINADDVPLSAAAHAALEQSPDRLAAVLTGGDDYELVFTAAAESHGSLDAIAARLGFDLTRIGTITDGSGVEVRNAKSEVISFRSKGYVHF